MKTISKILFILLYVIRIITGVTFFLLAIPLAIIVAIGIIGFKSGKELCKVLYIS